MRYDAQRDKYVVQMTSTDGLALAYASRVCLEMGGSPADGSAPPSWTSVPWAELPLLTRVRIWVGPTRLP